MRHQSLRRGRCALVVSGVLIACASVGAESSAVIVPPGGFDSVFPAAGTTHGWRFTIENPIKVTALGLFDKGNNGLQVSHAVGLWDEEGGLVGSVVVASGVSSPLIDRFRYADLDPVTLSPGQIYTVGFYTEGFAPNDGMIVDDGDFLMSGAIHYEGFGVSDFTDGLHIPLMPNDGGFVHRFGANFRFEVVPAPGTAVIPLIAGGVLVSRRRRRG